MKGSSSSSNSSSHSHENLAIEAECSDERVSKQMWRVFASIETQWPTWAVV
jgi:hypothetical protein